MADGHNTVRQIRGIEPVRVQDHEIEVVSLREPGDLARPISDANYPTGIHATSTQALDMLFYSRLRIRLEPFVEIGHLLKRGIKFFDDMQQHNVTLGGHQVSRNLYRSAGLVGKIYWNQYF